MSAVPVVGVILGGLSAAVAAGFSATDLPVAMIGVLMVVVLAVSTRGMHLDGLADTADGLGCYGPPDRVAEVMRSGSTGPFGVATVVAVMAVQIVGFAALTGGHRWYEIAFAVALGRLIAVIGCRRGLVAAHPDGFGALVAGTQRTSIAVWSLIAVLGAIGCGFTAPGFDVGAAIQAVIVTSAVLVAGWWFTAHCARRMGGINGDVLGAGIELGVSLTLVGLLV